MYQTTRTVPVFADQSGRASSVDGDLQCTEAHWWTRRLPDSTPPGDAKAAGAAEAEVSRSAQQARSRRAEGPAEACATGLHPPVLVVEG